MRRFLMVSTLVLAMPMLVACESGNRLGDLITAATSTIANPVDTVDIYRVKNAYAAALQASVDWRAYCYARPYAVLMQDSFAKPVCQNRRSTVRMIQLAKAKAHSAVADAQDFVAQHSTLNASVVITAAWRAVTNFQNAVPAK